MPDDQRLEGGVELVAVTQDPETLLQVRTLGKSGKSLYGPMSLDHLARSRRREPISPSYTSMTRSMSRSRVESDMAGVLHWRTLAFKGAAACVCVQPGWEQGSGSTEPLPGAVRAGDCSTSPRRGAPGGVAPSRPRRAKAQARTPRAERRCTRRILDSRGAQSGRCAPRRQRRHQYRWCKRPFIGDQRYSRVSSGSGSASGDQSAVVGSSLGARVPGRDAAVEQAGMVDAIGPGGQFVDDERSPRHPDNAARVRCRGLPCSGRMRKSVGAAPAAALCDEMRLGAVNAARRSRQRWQAERDAAICLS